MPTFPLRLVVLAAALSGSVAQGAPRAPCKPAIGATTAQVIQRCGKPDDVFSAPGSVLGLQQEWRYGAVYAGLIDGRVAYVLN